MKKLTLSVADLRVASFETDDRPQAPSVITGHVCVSRPTMVGTCCGTA